MSRGPPQLMFDDGSRVMVEDSDNAVAFLDRGDESSSSLPPTQRGTIPLHAYYEIDRMSREVIELLVVAQNNNGNDDGGDGGTGSISIGESTILRVALQFPDELLEDSPEVCWLLEDKMREDLEGIASTNNIDSTTTTPPTATMVTTMMMITPFCFVLGDTTVNSCCPDEVAALHLNADVLIHYGHACLSPTETLPVLYSFGKLDFENLDCAVELFQEARQERKQAGGNENENENDDDKYNNYLLLYQVGYHHAMMDLQERWMQSDGGKNNLRVVTAQIPALSRPQHQMPKRRSAATALVRPTPPTSCCKKPDVDVSARGTTATMVGESVGGSGCCGGNSGLLPAIVPPELSRGESESETLSSLCCRTKDDSPCNPLVPLPSSPANNNTNNNIIIRETESDKSNENLDRDRKSRPLVVGGLELPGDQISSWDDLSDFTVVFIMGNPEEDVDNYSSDDTTTPQQRQYANSMLCFLSLPNGEPGGGYWIYSPKHRELRKDVSPPPALKRQLKRRFFLTQKAKDANVFGILVSNLSQQHLVDVVKSLQTIIQDSNRTAYSFAVGKINPAKLANFAEIETFVIVACREHSLLDQEREYPIPVITPMELEIALDHLQWGMQAYSLDCQDLMIRQKDEDERKRKQEQEQKQEHLGAIAVTNEVTDDDDGDTNSVDSDAPYFSMVTGRYESRIQKGSRYDRDDNDLDLKALPGQGQVTEYKSEAANFLKQREYQGLESMMGQTEVKTAVLGMRGIASDYRTTNETNKQTNK